MVGMVWAGGCRCGGLTVWVWRGWVCAAMPPVLGVVCGVLARVVVRRARLLEDLTRPHRREVSRPGAPAATGFCAVVGRAGG